MIVAHPFQVNNNEKRLKYYEDKLLACLSASKGNLIDDEELIETLADAKKASARERGRTWTALLHSKSGMHAQPYLLSF